MSRKTVSMIGNLTRDMMSDVMETSLKKPIQTGEFRKNPVEPAWRCPAEYIYELVKTEQFVMEYLKPKQAVTGRVILQLHRLAVLAVSMPVLLALLETVHDFL